MLTYFKAKKVKLQNISSAAQPVPAAQSAPRKQATSRDILRMNQHMTQPQDRTVETEVDQYLSDQVVEHISLQFWLV